MKADQHEHKLRNPRANLAPLRLGYNVCLHDMRGRFIGVWAFCIRHAVARHGRSAAARLRPNGVYQYGKLYRLHHWRRRSRMGNTKNRRTLDHIRRSDDRGIFVVGSRPSDWFRISSDHIFSHWACRRMRQCHGARPYYPLVHPPAPWPRRRLSGFWLQPCNHVFRNRSAKHQSHYRPRRLA
mgnify:CR=1 FL=1